MLSTYKQSVIERTKLGIPPEALSAELTEHLVMLLQNPPKGEEAFLLDLITNSINPGVDNAALIKANFLTDIANNNLSSPLIDRTSAVKLLGTMQGGYNVKSLIALLDCKELAAEAAEQLKFTLLIFDFFDDVVAKSEAGNPFAKTVLLSWAKAEWFLHRPSIANKITLSVFKVDGETNTDDLSPATDAWSRPDIPLHALSMLKIARDGICPDIPGQIGPFTQINTIKAKGFPIAYVGDVVGTGSSRKSAANSILWHFGSDIKYVPNKRYGGFCFGSKIAPIFYNTLEDAGALPIEFDVSGLKMGDIIDLYPFKGVISPHNQDTVIAQFKLKTTTLLDEVRAGGRIPLIIGKTLTKKAKAYLQINDIGPFESTHTNHETDKGYTLAQKIVGKACGLQGVRPGDYCEPKITTVGSQDTTGTMTSDELKSLACLKFSADLVMQSLCHTSAYPKKIDIKTHQTLPAFFKDRGGIGLAPDDGIIHSWLNRMLLPDTVGTGGDSHTRFPMGISFPAGSGLVAFAAAVGIMPLDMPESVLVRFKGKMKDNITLRDLVHAIPYFAIQQGLLTIEKNNKKNIFSGRILEIEGLDDLTPEQAFELADASAERSAAACTIKLSESSIANYLRSNIVLLRWMIKQGYGDADSLARRAKNMEAWLESPQLLSADENAEYAAIIEIDLNEINEPILCAPNDPDDAKLLSELNSQKIDEVFIGSCMTNIGHFRASAHLLQTNENKTIQSKLWISPPTKMDRNQLLGEGVYNIFGRAGVRVEVPGCSLCMGNQARVAPNSYVVSTSTRNFPHRMGDNAHVYLASAELATIAAILGRLPTLVEYNDYMNTLQKERDNIYNYLNFDQIPNYVNAINISEV